MIVYFKYLILCILLIITSWIGIIISKSFSNRVKELKQIKSALNMIENKIKFTYEPMPEIFKEISEKYKGNVNQIFKKAYLNMQTLNAGVAWETSIDSVNCNLKQEDKDTLKGLGKLLGKTDIEGQISQIRLIINFLDTQIEKAESEQNKGEGLYKKLGFISGLMIVIVLI